MAKSNVLLSLFLFFTTLAVLSAIPIVKTKQGWIKGKTSTQNGFSMEMFLGIPYAKQLTASDRGKRPEAPVSWNGLKKMKERAPACLTNVHLNDTAEESYSEDCLYLNIFRPAVRSPCKGLLPVIFFIHGGGYQSGSAQLSPNDTFARHFTSRDVIVVNIQYRLAAHGFVSLNNSLVPGNLGLWDQAAALKYVSENILKFGGDPNKITVMGHSAGAVSAGFLSISPETEGLFSQLITLSGSSFGMTYVQSSLPTIGQQFFTNLGCTNDAQVLECFRNASLTDIFAAQSGISWYPAIGDEFMPVASQDAQLPPKPTLAGVMELEALSITFLSADPTSFPYIGAGVVEGYISTLVPQYGVNASLAQTRLNAHFSNETGASYPYYMKQFSKLLSNLIWDIPAVREAKARAATAPSFFYYFPYFNPAEFSSTFPVKETYHTHELPYLFGRFENGVYSFDDDDYIVQSLLLDSIANFVHYGNPSTTLAEWPTVNETLTYLKIGPTPEAETGHFDADNAFWEGMKDLGYDLVAGTPV